MKGKIEFIESALGDLQSAIANLYLTEIEAANLIDRFNCSVQMTERLDELCTIESELKNLYGRLQILREGI